MVVLNLKLSFMQVLDNQLRPGLIVVDHMLVYDPLSVQEDFVFTHRTHIKGTRVKDLPSSNYNKWATKESWV